MQRFPQNTVRFSLRRLIDSIPLIHMDSGEVYRCLILSEDVRCHRRRYLVGGWFDFLRQYNLRVDDVLKFNLGDPVDKLYVNIVRSKTL
jgi:hypothetical protein